MDARSFLILSVLPLASVSLGGVLQTRGADDGEQPRAMDATTWTDAERALRKAMDADPTVTSGNPRELNQPGAIRAWTEFLQRDDLTKEQQAFAWWRLGALNSYNLNRARGETPDRQAALAAYEKARELLSDVISFESLNTATNWGSFRRVGTESEELARLANSFNWLHTRTDDDVKRSALVVTANGRIIDAKFFASLRYRQSTVEQRTSFLNKELVYHKQFMAEKVSERIKYSNNPEAIATLLDLVQDVASPEQMQNWRAMQADLVRRVRLESPRNM
jgi:hypothetical protein